MKRLLLPGRKYIDADKIIYLESDSNYTLIYKINAPYRIIAARSLCHIHEALSSTDFVRINRHQIINLSFIKKFWEEKATVNIKLYNGSILKTSRRRSGEVLKQVQSAESLAPNPK